MKSRSLEDAATERRWPQKTRTGRPLGDYRRRTAHLHTVLAISRLELSHGRPALYPAVSPRQPPSDAMQPRSRGERTGADVLVDIHGPSGMMSSMTPNMLGAYGEWAAQSLVDPPRLSFRQPMFNNLDAWRAVARARFLEAIKSPGPAAPNRRPLQRQCSLVLSIRDGAYEQEYQERAAARQFVRRHSHIEPSLCVNRNVWISGCGRTPEVLPFLIR
jgi:hypothetical protein